MYRFRNVIFDLDGLICNTEPLYMRAANFVLKASGANYQFEPKEYGRVMTGQPVLLNASYMKERFALPQSVESLAQAILALFSVLVGDPRNVEPMPGLKEMISFLQAQNVQLAVASGSRPDHVVQMLSALKLEDAFSVLSSADKGVEPKPAPDIYLEALRLLRAEPAQSIAIEDSASGIRAARAAGLFVIAVKNEFTRHQDLSMASLVANSLLEAKDYLNHVG